MERIKKNFGFGCMRLPMLNGQVDTAEMKRMVDLFLAKGFNYFDTAHGYLGGKSELALKECLTQRYPRDRYILTNKLTNAYFNSEAEIRPLFESQLAACGVTYFDFYLMHAQSQENFTKFKRCRAYETSFQLKQEGKIRHVGISFHDKAEVLEEILRTYPQIEVVQIQFNYVDAEDAAVQSRACYQVCRQYNKPIIVMEPCKGGHLVNLPPDADAVLKALKGGSNASYAIRYAAGFEGIRMVLSGMSNLNKMKDNLSFMENFEPLSAEELNAVEQVRALLQSHQIIPCTACRYCTERCPRHISIPDLFACLNAKQTFHDWNADYYYKNVYTIGNRKASDCIQCGQCEHVCPQHLAIRKLLTEVAAEFEKG